MKRLLLSLAAFLLVSHSFAQTVDYSIVYVPEESGSKFLKITSDNDFVCMPEVHRYRQSIGDSNLNKVGIVWPTNKIIDVSPDGEKIAYLSARGDAVNVFVKDLNRQGSSKQRTSRREVQDFAYSPDGTVLAFSERVGKNNVIYQTSAQNGFVCRQITNGYEDYSPVYSKDMSKIFFTRMEAKKTSIWSYDLTDNFLSSYTSGMNPYPVDSTDVVLCARKNGYGKGEIWRIDYSSGVEECIVTDAAKSFSNPSLSPDGKWILFVGSSSIPDGRYLFWNTDLYVCRPDGSDVIQLTYHAADDLCPVWSKDGKFIYFISQRGSEDGVANIWRISFEN